jgi:FtsZ-binding cell division protein ZapB
VHQIALRLLFNMNGLADMLSGAKKMVQLKAQQVMQAVGVSAETKDLEYDGVRDEFLRLNEQLKKVCLLAAQLVKDMRSQANSQKELLGFMADVFERDDDAGQPAMNVFRIVSAGSKAALLEVGNKLELEVCSPIQKNLENLNPKVKLRMDERKKLQLALDHYKEKLQGLSRDDQSRALRNDSKSAEAFHMFQRSNDEIVLCLNPFWSTLSCKVVLHPATRVHSL